MRALLITLFLLALLPIASAKGLPQFEPESAEAWAYMLDLADEVVPHLYRNSSQGWSCQLSARETQTTLETLAYTYQLPPAMLAESVAAFFWSDWTKLEVDGYDINVIVTNNPDPKVLEQFLEAFYQQHEACLLTTLKVLVDGYEGYYKRQNNGHYLRLNTKTGEHYTLIALSADYFPGTGVFEPLGIVYGVRLAGLLKIDFIRKPAVEAITETITRRIREQGSALKIF
ncbi:MAG: hypothetical protein KC422_21325 [Trueperaceae bacterium]|nr:hypothetical protein [Trueperaceae bacterium]